MKDLQLAPVIENLKAVTECVTADMMGRAWPEKSIRIVSIVIDDFSDRQEQIEIFESHGYKVYTTESFNIDEIINS